MERALVWGVGGEGSARGGVCIPLSGIFGDGEPCLGAGLRGHGSGSFVTPKVVPHPKGVIKDTDKEKS